MFRRPALYHPYKPSVPAGFRIKDLFPKRFNLFPQPHFANSRSPDPSPLSSPVRGTGDSESDDAPPTVRLTDLFAACVGESPKRPTTPTPGPCRPKAPPNEGAAKYAFPKTRTTKGPKRLSFTNVAQGPRDVPPHRRSQQLKEKREALHERKLDAHGRRAAQARNHIHRLVKEAKTLMRPEDMNREDYIFLKQLKCLALDQELDHDLERYREQMSRAAAETEQRLVDHEARDKEAERLRCQQSQEEAKAERQKGLEEFMRRHEKEMVAEAMHADEQRRRAHEEEERKVREEQERRFRQEQAYKVKMDEERRLKEERQRQEREQHIREALARKAKEEEERRRQEERQLEEERRRQAHDEMIQELLESIERARRMARERRQREEEGRKWEEEVDRRRQEARERLIREERERLAREAAQHQARWRAEQARRAAEEEQIRQYFALYDGKWNELRTNNALPPVDIREMPWPVLGVILSAEQVTYQAVRTFLFHPQRTGVEGKSARDKVKVEVLRFHPDKFNTRIVPKIIPSQQVLAQEIAGAIARILTTIMTEEVD